MKTTTAHRKLLFLSLPAIGLVALLCVLGMGVAATVYLVSHALRSASNTDTPPTISATTHEGTSGVRVPTGGPHPSAESRLPAQATVLPTLTPPTGTRRAVAPGEPPPLTGRVLLGKDGVRIDLGGSRVLNLPASFVNAIQALREAGVPDNLLATLLLDQYGRAWSTEYRKLLDAIARGESGADDRMAFFLASDEARLDIIGAVLSENTAQAWNQQHIMGNLTASRLGISEDQWQALYQAKAGYMAGHFETYQQLYAGEIDRAVLQQRLADNDARLGQVINTYLAPAAFDEAAVRSAFQSFSLTPEQLQQVINVQRQFADARQLLWQQYQAGAVSAFNYWNGLSGIAAHEQQTLRSTLGRDSYRQYARHNDPVYQSLAQSAAQWNLSSAQVDSIYRTLRSYNRGMTEYVNGTRAILGEGGELDWDRTLEEARQYHNTTVAWLQQTLGPENYQALHQRGLIP